MSGAAAIPRKAGALQGVSLLLPVTMTVMGVVVLLPVLPALSEHFSAVPGASFWVPVLLTLPSLIIVLFGGAAGLLADLVGRRRLLIGAMVVYAVVGVAPFVLQSLPAIIATRFAVGLCEAVILVVSTTLIGDLFTGAARDKWLSWQIGFAAVVATVLIVLGGVLGSRFGWHGPFLSYGLALPLALLVLVFVWEPAPDVSAGEHAGRLTWAGFPWRRMGGICGVTIFASCLFYLIQTELAYTLVSRGVRDPQTTGLLLGLVNVGTASGAAVFALFSRQRVSVLLGVAFAIVGVTLFLIAHAQTPSTTTLWAFINQIGAGMVLPTLLTFAVRGLSFEHRGRGTGLWQSTFSLGQFLVSVGVPVLNRHSGSLDATYSWIGGITIAAAAIAFGMVALRPPMVAAAA